MHWDTATLTAEQVNEGLYGAGYALLERGDLHNAAALLRLLLVRAPEQSRNWLALGYCHEQGNDPDVAAWLYEQGIEACEDEPGQLRAALDRVCQGRSS